MVRLLAFLTFFALLGGVASATTCDMQKALLYISLSSNFISADPPTRQNATKAMRFATLAVDMNAACIKASNNVYWKLIGKRGDRVVFVKNLDLRGELALIAGKPLEFRPGSSWAYSNTNYALLGAVVAKASGMSWKTYVRKHLLVPAGMTDSGFEREPVPGGELATGYGLARRTFKPIAVGSPPGEGDGGIVSTAHDLARWNAALFGGRIVSRPSLARMTAPGPHPEGPTGYGFGLQIDVYDGVRRISHGGLSLGYTSTDASTRRSRKK